MPEILSTEIEGETKEVSVFYRFIDKNRLHVVTKGANFIDINPLDLISFLKRKDIILCDENLWKQDGPIKKFVAKTQTSSFVFKKI